MICKIIKASALCNISSNHRLKDGEKDASKRKKGLFFVIAHLLWLFFEKRSCLKTFSSERINLL